MTTLDDLVRAVELHPTNPIIAAMLTDELIDTRGMTRTEADRRVADVQRVASDAVRMRTAAALMAEGSRSRRHLLTAVYRECHVPRASRPTVLVTTGDTVRITDGLLPPDRVRFWGGAIILVGATWLIHVHQVHSIHVRQLRRATRLRRRAR